MADNALISEEENCNNKPIEQYDMTKYPFLAIDFFDGDKEFYKPEEKEAHLPSKPEEC